jgi:tetratricopeptide (TPR) repeat protein
VELVERESALAELAGLARRAQAGDGGLVLVAGEAGVGKTALLERLARDLPDARWSWGACDGLFTPRPLGPLFDLASHREAAAQYRRAVRFAAEAEPETAAGLYGALAREASLVDQWAEAEQAGTRALELWRQLGDRQREGDTLNQLTRVHERLCRGADAAAAAESAVAILRPLGASRELATAYGVLAVMRMVAGRHAEAIGLARQAAEMAHAVDATAVLSDALNTLGCSLSLDDDDWRAPLRQALAIAVGAGLPEQAGRAFANLHSISCEHRRFAEAERYYADGFRYTDEHDIGVYVNCLRGSRVFMLEQTGLWDEAVSVGGQLLATAASPINRRSPCRLGGGQARRPLPRRRGRPAAAGLLARRPQARKARVPGRED